MRELTFSAPFLYTTFDGYRFGALNVRSQEIPLDDAADLSNNTWGGPQAWIHKSSTWQHRDGRVDITWNVNILAFIHEELLDVADQVERLLREEGTEKYEQYLNSLPWRFRDGGLHLDELGLLSRQ